MNTIPLIDLFTPIVGIASSQVSRHAKDSEYDIPYIRPSKTQNGSIDAYVDKRLIPDDKIFPSNTLYVSTDGQGSHTYSYVSVFEFVPNSNVTVLIPKRHMSLEEKLFYAHCITRNRYKFSYGRKPKGTRLESIKIPSNMPNSIKDGYVRANGELLIRQTDFPIDDSKYPISIKNVPLSRLFDIENGIASSQVVRSDAKENENWIPYIRPSYKQETSIDAYVNKNLVPSEKIFPAGTLYVSTDGQGSHTFSYVSTFEFVPNSNVSVLIPKRKMSLQEKLYYAHCITNNRYKFSYGRKPKGERLQTVLIPEYPPKYVTDYNIDKVIKSFSGVLDMV